MNLKLKIYHLLVNRVPAIQKKYHSIRQQKNGIGGRMYAWLVLCGMNVQCLIAKRKYQDALYNPDKKKKPPKGKSESALSFREPPQKLAERLKAYDVISFDIFDTLVFRPFSSPTDLFYVVGEKLDYLDFERIRREMEWRARKKAKKEKNTYEVTLSQIYDELEEQAGVDKETGMQAEMESESELCFGNPYMLEVFRYLQDSGKKIICISDMYLPKAFIRQLVEKCGFRGISEYFISCECGASKGGGGLFTRVKETCGRYKKYIHVGDHPEADVRWAKKSGFAAVFYQNVNMAGMPYRAEDMSVITGSVYRGIVNTHIHNGLYRFNREYELGFIYGGLFVVGYCQWIHEYVQTHEIDKILFLSRDGDILKQVYSRLYPEESRAGRTEYVYWSRFAAAKMSAGDFKYDYFRRFLYHKVNQGYTLETIFKSMEIEDMLEGMLEEVHREGKMTVKTHLTDKNVGIIRKYLIKHWGEVLSHYTEQLKAGKQYYEKIFAGCRKAAAVDVGWAGSGAVTLNHIVNKIWHLNCEIIGLIAGTNSVHNAEPNMSEPQLHSGRLISYMFSQEHNREIWKWHDAAKNHNLAVELLCSSTGGSLRGFYPEETADGRETYMLQFKDADVDSYVVEEIQRGIKDFVEKFVKVSNKESLLNSVTGSDVYSVLRIFLQNGNYESFMKAVNSSGRGVRMEMGI